jgi:hypothetical protein
VKICLGANTLCYPDGGGHMWAYLNWALGLSALGLEVIWLEGVGGDLPEADLRDAIEGLRTRLAPYGLDGAIALWARGGGRLAPAAIDGCLDAEAAAEEADLLIDLGYFDAPDIVARFRRSALVDIDPGRLQLWMRDGALRIVDHDVYFTLGQGVGRDVPDAGLEWHHTSPCVAVDRWTPRPEGGDAAFTTVSHWSAHEWMEDELGPYCNDKRSGFLPFLELPRHSGRPLELALCMADDEADERRSLEQLGWRVRDSAEVAGTPDAYQRYVQESLGEFSCAKPSSVKLRQGWISDRTVCYLASGRPAVVQDTGPTELLPHGEGVFRFRDLDEAARCLEAVVDDYDRQSRLARELAEEHFDARKVAGRVVEVALA